MRLEVQQHRAERVCRAVYRAARGGGGEVDVDPELRLSPDRHWPGEPGGAGPTWRDGPDLSPRGRGVPEARSARGSRRTCPRAGSTTGFELTRARSAPTFNREWPAKLFEGGWICASWPKEYGGKGLSTMEAVVLNEEFAKAGAPAAGRLLRRHPRRADHPAVGHRGAEEGVPAQDPLGRDRAGARASASPTPAPTSPSLKTTAVLDGDEWVINGQKIWTTQGSARRLHLPARPHRPRRAPSTRASRTCWSR